ncbi:MAG: hypothetical protein WCA98_09765 [Candidatus Acidiferrales bacterium]
MPQQQTAPQTKPASAPPQQVPANKDQSTKDLQEQNGTSNDRLSWMLPDFLMRVEPAQK